MSQATLHWMKHCHFSFLGNKDIGHCFMGNEMKPSEFMGKINVIQRSLSKHSYSFIQFVDSNACEQFNSVCNKFIGSKWINFPGRKGYLTRMTEAFDSKQYLRKVHKKCINGQSPGKIRDIHRQVFSRGVRIQEILSLKELKLSGKIPNWNSKFFEPELEFSGNLVLQPGL